MEKPTGVLTLTWKLCVGLFISCEQTMEKHGVGIVPYMYVLEWNVRNFTWHAVLTCCARGSTRFCI
jgi:hypothetical protein